MPNLYQFTLDIPEKQCTNHQYLLLCKDPILISTGNKKQIETILPIIKKILYKKTLKYIFLSYIKSNECDGLDLFLKEYPNVIIICSPTGQQELLDCGYKGTILSKKHEDILNGEDYSFKFIGYPSKILFQEGLLLYEQNRKIFFSIDFMKRIGYKINRILTSSWYCEVNSINLKDITNYDQLSLLQNNLKRISPNFIAVGHGYCIQCK